MSNIEERIVSMKFDNTGFEAGATKAIEILDKLKTALKLDKATDGLDAVKKSVGDFSMDSVSSSVDECSSRFGAFEAFVAGIFLNLGNRAANFGITMAKNLTVKPLMDGFGEYETQMRSVQTILSNSGEKLKEQGFTTQEQQIERINQTLDDLNTYADKTIYNFSEMTRNIGTFTAAGVDLDTATTSIKGIANLAAASGSTSQQASTAMYQLSQAIASGTVKLQDWNSVVNAGMGGELFQDALKRTARNHGIAVDEMIEKNGSFRESLQEGWITSDILTETLSQLTMSYEEVGDEAYNTNLEILKNQGYSQEDAEAILDLAKNAEEAATKVRTWTQLWDTVGEALGSGWATTWRTIVGDFLEATDLFTHLSEGITGIIGASADARNKVLADWAAAGGRTALVDGIKYSFDAIVSIVKTIGDAFSDVFGISAEQLYNISTAFAEFAEKLVPTEEVVQWLYDAFYNVFTVIHSVIGVFGNVIRVIFDVAGVVWKLIQPFVTLAAIIFGKVLGAFGWFSSLILKITDYIEGFVSIVSDKLGGAIDFVYGVFGRIGELVGWFFGQISGAASIIPELIGAVGNLILSFEPIKKVGSWFEGIKNTIANTVTGAFDDLNKAIFGTEDATKDVAKSFENLTPFEKAETILEDISHKVSTFAEGFIESGDKVQYLRDSFSNTISAIENKITGFFEVFKNPKTFYDALEAINDSVVDFIYNTFGQTELADKIYDFWSFISDPIYQFFLDFANNFDTWEEVLNSKFGGIIEAVKSPFVSLFDYFKGLSKSGKTIPQIIGTVLSDAYDKVTYWIFHIPEAISNARTYLTTKFQEFLSSTSDFRSRLADSFKNLINNLPSPEELGAKIGQFVGTIKTAISNLFSNIGKGDGEGIDFSGIFAKIPEGISKAFEYISKVKDGLPQIDFVGIFSGIVDGILDALSTVVDTLPIEEIGDILDKLIDKVKTIIMKKPWMMALAGVLDYIHSIAQRNRGIGGLGKNLRKGAEAIGEGLSKFGEGFTNFKKQTKAQAFQRIAVGLLIIAGALWVLAQIPADRLMDVSVTLAVMGAGIAALMLGVSKIAAMGNLDLESIGRAMAGFGIGLLALAGAVWIFTKIPAENIYDALGPVVLLIVTVGSMMALIAKAGGNLTGAAATLIAMGIAINLLMIPIQILGRTPMNVLVQGGVAVGLIAVVLSACVALMERATRFKGSILGAAPALLALAIAINLAIAPIQILGRTPMNVLVQGGVAVGLIAVVLSACIAAMGFFGSNAGSILAAVPALLALVAAVTLAIIPIYILGNMDKTVLHQGGNAVGLISAVLAGVVVLLSFLAANVAAVLAGSAAMVVMAIAIGAVAAVVAALAAIASMNLSGLEAAVDTLYYILGALALGLAGVSALGPSAGLGLLAIAAGIAAIGVALMIFGAGVALLQGSADWGGIIASIKGFIDNVVAFFGSLVTAAQEGIGNFLGFINGKAGDIQGIGASIGTWLWNAISGLPGKFKTLASNAVGAIGSGIGAKISSAVSKVKTLVTNLINPTNQLKPKLKTNASGAISALMSAISSKFGSLSTLGKNVVSRISSGMSNVKSKFRDIGKRVVEGFGEGISSLLDWAKGKAQQLMDVAEKAAKAKGKIKSPSRVFMAIGGYVGEGFIIGMANKIRGAYAMGTKLAGTVPDAFSDTLTGMSVDIDDILDTDYNPVITPVINSAEFDSGMDRLSNSMRLGLNDFSVGNLNYTGELSAKISDYNDLNRMALTAMAENAIDYDLLGVKVANAFIASGVHVKMEGGQLVGYLAGEISDVRRMYE